MTTKKARASLNPSLALTFLIVSVTGVLMLFHIKGWGIVNLHEWMSIVFLVLCAVHLALNWKPLWFFLKNGRIVMSIVVVSLLSALLLLGGQNKEGRGGPHGRAHSGSTTQLDVGHK